MPTDHDIPKLIINKLTDAQYEQAVKNADELYLTPDSGGLPDQTGQSGKYLTTNGTTASWGTVSIPTVNNSTITIQKNSTTVDSFTLNQSSNKTIDISVPTKTSDLQNDSGFTTNTGTVTSVQVQAGTGLTSSQSSAQTTTLSTTIEIDSGYKLPTTAEFSAKEDVPTEVSESSASVTLDIAANTNYDLTNTDITDITLMTSPTMICWKFRKSKKTNTILAPAIINIAKRVALLFACIASIAQQTANRAYPPSEIR